MKKLASRRNKRGTHFSQLCGKEVAQHTQVLRGSLNYCLPPPHVLHFKEQWCLSKCIQLSLQLSFFFWSCFPYLHQDNVTDQIFQNAETLLKKLGTRDNVKVLY